MEKVQEKVKRIDLAWIVVSDLKKAVQFFTEKVGLKINELNEHYGWAELSGHEGGATLGVALANNKDPISPGYNAVTTFMVENIEKATADLAKKDVLLIGTIIEVPNIVKMQFFADSDGNKFQLVQSLDGHKT